MARLTWVLAVAGLTFSASAISSLNSPSAGLRGQAQIVVEPGGGHTFVLDYELGAP